MTKVAVTGAEGAVAARLVERLASADDLDLVPLSGAADVLVHLAGPAAAGPALDAAGESGVRRVVLVSSARAYGAWPDNPIPLREDARLRPNPGCPHATAAAEAERVLAEWRETQPEAPTSVVLRPATVVLPGEPSAAPGPVRDSTAPAQFLHADDLASAVYLAITGPLDGAYNVAPDGWIPQETVRALVHGPLTVPRPERALRAVAAVRRRFGQRVSPASVAFWVHPWVVGNDRLRSAGWAPSLTNEEAWVASQPGSPLQELSPGRRQQLSLVAGGLGIAAGLAGAVALVRRGRRVRRD